MPETGDLQGRVEQLLPGGEALVRMTDGVLLAANGVPGYRVVLADAGKRRGAQRGHITGLLEASPMRIKADCPVAAECGGCALQYVDVGAQADIKSDWVFKQFERFVHAETEWMPVQDAPLPGMRRRARWHRGEDEAGSFLGFHSRSSNRVVRAPLCAIVHADMDALRLAIESILPPVIESLRMIRLYDGMHVVFETGEGAEVPSTEVFAACLDIIRQTELNIQPWLRAGVVLRPLIKPVQVLHDYLPAGENWVELAVGPEDFVQGHAAGNVHILRQIQAWAGKPKRIADLFCGIGNLSLPLAASCGAHVIGADVAESSIRAARANARSLGVQAEFEALNLFDGVREEHYAGADVLLLDPPRKGAKAICKAMGRLMPEKIIMVNCDIAAGARDAEMLHARGYRMQALRALDIFPFSGHVEAMSFWTRK